MLLVPLAAAFIVGVVVGGTLPAPGWTPLALSLAVFAGTILVRRRRWAPVLLCLSAALLGVGRSPHASPATAGDLSFYNGRTLQVNGQVDAEPDVRDTGANYEIAAASVTLGKRSLQVRGKLTVHTPRAVTLEYGDAVQLTGALLTPRDTATIPYREILAQRGIGSEMSFPRVTDLGPSTIGLLGWIVPLRQRLENGIDQWLPEPEAALLIAISLGARSASLGDLAPALIATGLIHLIAISGIKVAIVAGVAHSLTRASGNRLLALSASLLGLVWYVLLTGATASGERSALMWALVFIAWYLGRGTVTVVSLAVVAAVMVGLDSALTTDIGFLMSTVGTFGIVVLAPWIERVLRVLPSPFREALSVTIAAQFATLPIVVFGFNVVSLSGPLANALVLPLLPVLMLLGFALGAAAGIASLAAPISSFTYVLLHAVVWLSQHLPVAISLAALPTPVTLLYYAALLILAARLLGAMQTFPAGRRPSHAREVTLAFVAGGSLLTQSLLLSGPTTSDSIRWLGSGNAVLVQSRGMTALIDGSRAPMQLLERLGSAIPFRQHTIDLLVVDDVRSASIGGLVDVLDHYAVLEVLDTGIEYPSATYAAWRAALRDRHIPAYALRTGVHVRVGGVGIEAIAPDALYPKPQDSAGMLRLSADGRVILLAEDASLREQDEALFRGVSLHATVLVCGSTPCLPEFAREVRPSTVFGAGTYGAVGRIVPLTATAGTDLTP